MGSYKTEVFIASRFDEFKELRDRLCREIAQTESMAPIDLNDGHARPQAPLAECLSRVRRADLMLLLLGETYGAPAPGSKRSFTHLEYDEAVRETSKTRVLVYLLKGSRAQLVEPSLPDAWLRELHEKHTVCRLAGDEPSAQASEIINHLHAAHYQLFGSVHEDDADAQAGDLPEVADEAFEDGELDTLEAIEAEARGEYSASAEDEPQFEGRPAATAALEQRLEAERAVTLREYGIAIQHLKRALEFRPLDGPANFHLARLYVVLDRHDRLGEAANLAERAARIASDERRPYRASAAYLLAARARTKLGDAPGAHAYVDLAVDAKPGFAKAHLERARIFCWEGKKGQGIGAVRVAFQSHNTSLQQALQDPDLQAIREDIRELLRDETRRWAKEIEQILAVEAQLNRLLQRDLSATIAAPSPSDSLQTLRRRGQASVARQRDCVSLLLGTMEREYLDSLPETRSGRASLLGARISHAERELEKALEAERSAADALAAARELPDLLDWRVVLPFLSGIVLAFLVPWQWLTTVIGWGAVGIAGVRLWRSRQELLSARAVLAAALAQHGERVSSRELVEATLAQLKEERFTLRARGDAARALAQRSLAMFEHCSLAMPARYQPYSNLRRARRGMLVRLSERALEQFEADYGRRVERDDANFWLSAERNDAAAGDASETAEDPNRFALYLATVSSPNLVRLSRRGAYQTATDSEKASEATSHSPPRHSGIFSGPDRARVG